MCIFSSVSAVSAFFGCRSRAGLLASLICSLSPGSALAEMAPSFHSLDHVLLQVTDLARSQEFYRRLFGPALWRDRQLALVYQPLGKAFLALRQAAPAGVLRLGFGITAYDPVAARRYLTAQHLAWQELDGRDLQVDDSDGTAVQLVDEHRWEQLLATSEALPTGAAREPLFNALGIDEAYVMVSNLEVDSLHYARLLGQTGKLQAGSLWFDLGGSRLRLSQAPVGQPAGVHAIAVLVSSTDLTFAAEQVFAAGGIIEDILPNGFSFWDPDGLRVEVHVAPQILGSP